MKPSPIPEAEMFPGHQLVTFRAAEGLTTSAEVHPVEAQAGYDEEMGMPMFRVRVELEAGDAERLAAGEPFWLTFWGHMPIFDVAMTEVLEPAPVVVTDAWPNGAPPTECYVHGDACKSWGVPCDKAAEPAPARRVADWEDTSVGIPAAHGGIPTCRHCHRVIDGPLDHTRDCWVTTHAT